MAIGSSRIRSFSCGTGIQAVLPGRRCSPDHAEVLVSWKRFLIVPNVLRLQRHAPKDVSTRWDTYWEGISRTGEHGDVLWDTESATEAKRYIEELRRHCDLSLPIVDAGCGNGRFTRVLAEVFPFTLGVDLAPHAITRAVDESRGIPNLAFRAMDLTASMAGTELAAELGEANVLVRGVFHTLDLSDRQAMARNLRDVLGARGTLLLAETDFPGSILEYLQHLGATPTSLPKPLERAITTGIPRPAHFGSVEMAECFPSNEWEVLLSEKTLIETVPMRTPSEPETLPGWLAILRTRLPAPTTP
jgi:SAM-dependent methyltransferase